MLKKQKYPYYLLKTNFFSVYLLIFFLLGTSSGSHLASSPLSVIPQIVFAFFMFFKLPECYLLQIHCAP